MKALARLTIPLHPGSMYLGGTMTAYGVMNSVAGGRLSGWILILVQKK